MPSESAQEAFQGIMSRRGLLSDGDQQYQKHTKDQFGASPKQEVDQYSFNLFRGMEHSSCPLEMQEVAMFINKMLPKIQQ